MNDNNMIHDPNMDVRSAVAQRQRQLENVQHGDIITDKDGIPGIVIDKEEVLRKELETPQIESIKDKLKSMDDEIQYYASGNNLQYNRNAPNPINNDDTLAREKDIIGRVNPNNPETSELRKVSEAFAQFDIGSTGLVPKGSAERVNPQNNMNFPQQTNIPEETIQQNVPQQPINATTVNQDGTMRYVDSDVPAYTENKEVVQFNVPANNVRDFMNSMTNGELKKVSKASTIIVNEIKEINIPVAKRTISSFDEFKRIVNRHTEVDSVETVLVNSGYVATFKGCGALAMATLLPNGPDESVDYSKQYQFCYDNLVNTSIGKLSYNEFCLRTHLNDIPTCLLAILRASDPDENAITIECAECHTEYEVKYRLSQLLDNDSISDKMSAQIDKIVAARYTYDDAMKAHMESPVMQVKYAQVSDENTRYTIEIKPANGSIIIERFPIIKPLAAKYSQYVAAIITYIPKITIEILGADQSFDIVDPYAIAEILSEFDLDTIRSVGKIISSVTDIEIASPSYSFKGKYKCPKCGREEENIPCTIESLVFYRAVTAMR